MMPPRRDPSRRPSPGSKGPAATPGKASGSAGKASSKPAPAAKAGTPPPTPAKKPPTKLNRSSGSSGQLRRAPAKAARSGGGNSAKTKMIAMGAVGGLAVLIGIMWMIHAGQKDYPKIKAELKGKIAEVAAIGDDQILDKDKRLEDLLKNPDYINKNICGQEAINLTELHDKVHPKADLQRKADEEVKPFLDEFGPKKEKLDVATASTLIEKVTSLLSNYTGTTYTDALQAARKDLDDWLQANGSKAKWQDTVKGMQITVDRLLPDGKFKSARKAIDDFKKAWPDAKEDPTFKSEVQKPQDKLNRKIGPHVKELLGKSKEAHDHGQDPDAKKMLQDALPELEGFAEAKDVEAALKNLK